MALNSAAMPGGYLKRFLFLILLGVSGAILAQPKIAVVDFDTHQYSADLPGAQLADYVVDELVNTGMFEVVEREKLDSAMREIGFGQSGMVDPSTASAFGRQMGAKYLLTGRVISMDSEQKHFTGYGVSTTNTIVRLSVSVRILEVESGRIEFSTRTQAQQVFNEGGGLRVESSNPYAPLSEEVAVNIVAAIQESGKFSGSRGGSESAPDAPRKVDITLSSQPEGADVEIDGVFYGNTGSTLKVPEGLRRIRITLAGYQPWEKQVMVSEGVEFTATLAPERE